MTEPETNRQANRAASATFAIYPADKEYIETVAKNEGLSISAFVRSLFEAYRKRIKQ